MKVCTSCVMDSSTLYLNLDEGGRCSFCRNFVREEQSVKQKIKQFPLDHYLKGIRKESKAYDCIIGASGGVDSSYLMYWAAAAGLRPLIVHVDTGWNDQIAVSNIYRAVEILNFDLEVYVVDWRALKEIQRAFILSGALDLDVPQDHIFPNILLHFAIKYGVKDILSGHNYQTEFVIPRDWSYNSADSSLIRGVCAQVGGKVLKDFPLVSQTKFLIKKKIHNIRITRPLYYFDYNYNSVKQVIKEEIDWVDYGGKHYESVFTKVFQGIYLPQKFKIDKRRAHYSNLVMAGVMTRQSAFEALKLPPISDGAKQALVDVFLDKLEISKETWTAIIEAGTEPQFEFDRMTDQFFPLVRSFTRALK